MVTVKANPNCKVCHGRGYVIDWVPYGMGNTAMHSDCDCIYDNLTDEQIDLLDKGLISLTVESTEEEHGRK